MSNGRGYFNKLYNPFRIPLTKENLEALVAESCCMAEVIVKSGRKVAGGTYQQVKEKIRINEIDTSHFTGALWSKGIDKSDPRYKAFMKRNAPVKYDSDEKIFKIDPTIPRSCVKKYILRNNSIPYVCAICGNTGEWQGRKLSLELDHQNGINFDHRQENLRFLCPNCHAITDNYTGKNATPERRSLIQRVEMAIRHKQEIDPEDLKKIGL